MEHPQPLPPEDDQHSRRTFLVRAGALGAAVLVTGGATPPDKKAPEKPDEKKDEKKILSRCGYRCDLCAARSDDPAVRQKLVDGWRKYFGHTMYTVDNVKCGGCDSEVRADKTCKVRPCVIAKDIPNCGHCPQCPCDKLKPLCSSPHLNFLRFRDVPPTDYDLCMRQFDNIPELMSIRKELKGQRTTKE